MRQGRRVGARPGLAAATLIALLPACGASPPQAPPLMWRIASNGVAPSYVLGTLHLGVAAKEELPLVVWDAFSAASTLVVETDLRAIDAADFLNLAQLPAGTTLNTLLSSAGWRDLLRLLPEANPAALGKLKPWAAQMEVFREIFPGTEGMDLTFLEEADAAGMTLVSLETWQAQLAPYEGIPLAEGAAALEFLLAKREAIVAATAELVRVYKEGDWPQVQAQAIPAGAVPDRREPFYGAFIRDRNEAWYPALERTLRGGGAFVAVGFGHLMNSESLLAALTHHGFEVTRVSSKL